MLKTEANYLVFSEQAILNCMQGGCVGGKMHHVWKFIANNGVPIEEICQYEGEVCPNE